MPPKERNVPILGVERRWECPNCETVAVTNEARPHTEMHHCPGFSGLIMPMVEESRRSERGGANKRSVRVSPAVREDYVGDEKGLTYDDEGRPIMAVRTEYPDGSNDTAVYAPAAQIATRGKGR